ncbi:MAG: hypothetical protein IPK17_32350 [Chloroflexi bacterium]|uniref:pirin family protein n=1 Tax=Candidatus Flexifilum breve TaxID=3140694 RepID=UPI0031363C2D|nr:hypothetical protein [Chloroflexota bacterium]
MFQIWFIPIAPNLSPDYARTDFIGVQPKNILYPVVVPAMDTHPPSGALVMQADGWVFMANITPGQTVRHTLHAERKLFVYVISGQISVNGLALADHGTDASSRKYFPVKVNPVPSLPRRVVLPQLDVACGSM